MIRTSLIKGFKWNLNQINPHKWEAGYVQMGTGHTWEEISMSAKEHKRLVVSGWCGSVGIAGEIV